MTRLMPIRDGAAPPVEVARQLAASGAAGALHVAAPVVFLWLLALASKAAVLEPSGSDVSLRWPEHVKEFRLEPASREPNWKPIYPGAAAESKVSYRRGDVVLQAYGACYTRQKNGSELVGYYSSPAGAAGREIESNIIADDQRLAELSWLDQSGARWIGFQTYRIGSHLTGSPSVAKFLHLTLVRRNPEPICTLVVATPCASQCRERRSASRLLAAHLIDTGPPISP